MKKIAITGSSGFVGSYLVKYFTKLNFDILSFDRKIWDLREKYNGEFDCDIFIHSAADTGYEKSKKEMIKNNVEINENILDLVNKSNCKHFIYISSSSVYQGKSENLKVSDKINLSDLENSYSLTKYLSEEYIKNNLSKNIKLTILRPRAIYGDGDRVLVPNILKNQIFGKLILPGNGKNKTSITEINDFIEFIGKIVLNKNIGNVDMHSLQNIKIYNFSSEIKTYNQLFSEISKKYNLKGIIHIPLFIFNFLSIFNKNKYSYIIDTFGNDKILNVLNKLDRKKYKKIN